MAKWHGGSPSERWLPKGTETRDGWIGGPSCLRRSNLLVDGYQYRWRQLVRGGRSLSRSRSLAPHLLRHRHVSSWRCMYAERCAAWRDKSRQQAAFPSFTSHYHQCAAPHRTASCRILPHRTAPHLAYPRNWPTCTWLHNARDSTDSARLSLFLSPSR